jgi:hypothetical protein
MTAARLPTGRSGGFNEAASFRRRFALALALSLALHTAAVFGLRAGRGAGADGSTPGPHRVALLARLVAAADQGDETGRVSAESASAASEQALPAPRSTDQGTTAGSSGDGRPRRPAAAGALPLDLARVGYYYLASRLQVPPKALGDIPFEYPEDSPLRIGVVQARVLINVRGGVDDAIVEMADPPGVFDAAAVKALLKARFSPGSLHGIAVASQLLVEISYTDPGSSTLPGVGISVRNR